MKSQEERMYSEKGILHNSFVVKKAYDTLWDDIMEQFGLTRAEIDVLAFLDGHPDHNTAHDIVEYRMIAKSHVSKAVDHLLERKLLVREQDKLDRRCMHLIPTEAAERIIFAIREKQQEFRLKLTEGFTEDELLFFSKIISRFADNASALL